MGDGRLYHLVISIFGDEIPQNWQEICVFTELPIAGQEGQFNNSDSRLRGLGLAFRHGVRSAFFQFLVYFPFSDQG